MTHYTSNSLIFLKLFWHRYNENKLNMAAGYLTYSTMLALVPLVMVSLAIFSAFPVFKEISGEVQDMIFSNFAPQTGGVVQDYINEFVENSKKMSGIGIIGLIVVALMLISSIDRTLNDIWPNTNSRTLFVSFAMYWMILTLGPLILGVSVIVSSYIFSSDAFSSATVSTYLLSIIPFLLTWLAFTLIYIMVPNTKVNSYYAMIGALIAAIFFTLGKRAFTWYITAFPSYQLIYGAMATLPILLLWIQLSWTFVLFGAQLTAVLEDMRLIKNGKLPNNREYEVRQEKLQKALIELQHHDDEQSDGQTQTDIQAQGAHDDCIDSTR